MRSAGYKRSASRVVIGAAAVMLSLGGCDNEQNRADKETRISLAEAQAKISQNSPEAANQQLTLASQNSASASASLRASIKASLAQSELEAGQKMMGEISRLEMDLSRVGFEISQLAAQIRASGSEVAASRLYDPKPAKDTIAAAIADAQGGPDKPAWFTTGTAVLPTLVAAQAQVAKLQADLSAKQDQARSLTQQRGVLIDQAEQASSQTDQLKGLQGLELYKRSSDLRRQAGEISVQIDTLQNEISKVQKNLTVAKTQESAVTDAITQLRDQVATLDKTWQEVDAKSSEHQKIAARILGTPGPATPGASVGGSVTQKAAEWDRLVKEIRTKRREAEVKLANAAQYFDDARKAADELRKELAERIANPGSATPDQITSLQNTKQVMDPAQFRLQNAAAQRTLGELYLSDAASASSRASVVNALRTALDGTTLRIPPELLGGDLNNERVNALKSADAAFKESHESLDNIENGVTDLKEIKITSKVAHALTLYSWAQVARQSGNEKDAKDRIQAAKNARDQAAAENAKIPNMPPELGEPPKPAPPAAENAQADAATQPAAAPAAQ